MLRALSGRALLFLALAQATVEALDSDPAVSSSTVAASTSAPSIPRSFDHPAVSSSSADLSATALSEADKEKTLAEMRERRIIDAGAQSWSPEDKDMLVRIREAENWGAFDLLRDQLGSLRGCVALRKQEGSGRQRVLTRAGFRKYLFLKSQMARRYFEERGTDAKFVFQMHDLNGKRLFDGDGVLTSAGDSLYTRILRGGAAKWKEPNGTVSSNTQKRF